MMRLKTYIGTLLLVAAALLSVSCEKTGDSKGAERNVLMLMKVGERDAVDYESQIHSLRLWAFVGDNLAGYYENSDVTVTPLDFLVDMKMYSSSQQNVQIYAIANEASMGTLSVSLKKDMTRKQLDDLTFMSVRNTDQYGVPMFYKGEVSINVEDVATDNLTADDTEAVNKDEHIGHTLIRQKVGIELRRCVAKLELYVAKQQGDESTLKILEAKILESGTKTRQYCMPQTDVVVASVPSSGHDIELDLTPGAGNVKAFEGLAENRREPGYFTEVVEPHYMFENSFGSDFWETQADERGTALSITYQFNEEVPVTRIAYLPAIVRNNIHRVLCIINNEGQIILNYNIADWTNVDWNMEFDFPTYSNPAVPHPHIEGQTAPYPQPTVYYNPVNPEEGSFAVEFSLTAPVGQRFQPTLDRGTTAFTVKVFQDGREITDSDLWIASDKPYIIRVYAERPENVGEKCRLSITYFPEWLPEAQYLLINGRQNNLAYEGSSEPEHIDILQISK